MPYAGEGIDITLPAAAAFTSTSQYKFMIVDADGRGTIATAATDEIIGILQNTPGTADAGARIRIAGVSKILMSAAANEGAKLTANAEGFGVTTTTDRNKVGAILLHAVGGSGDINDCLVVNFWTSNA